jgi:hypothetical protein
MGNFLLGFLLACAIMNPVQTKVFLGKGVDAVHHVYQATVKNAN